MNANSDRLIELFGQAMQKRSGAERARFLAEACPGQPELRAQIEKLVRAHEQAEGFLEPTLEVTEANKGEEPGTMIGRYKLLEKLGEGGWGAVYVAEQQEPVHRRVAIKVIKLGMDTKQIIARFEAERQALALMDHPNIAKVFDAGATDTGRPFFVMELIRGIKITDYCDQANLGTKERLNLFIQVCHAVQHAHQKGIIHRDLKPSNILVTLHDGVPVPKVIDFGIAKATEGRLAGATVYTQLHQFVGTPAYMSPEQAEMSGLDIDTRSDIYSLGVLLYEILTGRPPFNPEELMASGLEAMRLTIREKEPIRPSACLARLPGEELTTTAKRRSIEAPKLIHQLQGDLDWIVMKCLEKDRTRRYEAANGLAQDIERHLSHEPVAARSPSTLYRLQKAIRRNRLAFAAGTAVVAALVIGIAVSTAAFLREREARMQAAAAERAREVSRLKAEAESVRADEMVGFIQEFFDATIPKLSQQGHQEAIRHLLAISASVASRLTNAPATEAQIRLRIGRAYSSYLRGDSSSAEQQFVLAEKLGRRAGETGRAVADLAYVHRLAIQQSRDPKLAEEFRQAGLKALNPASPNLEVAAYVLSSAATDYSYGTNHAEAEKLARQCLLIVPDDIAHASDRLFAMDALCRSCMKRKAWSEAATAAREALAIFPKMRSGESFRMKDAILRNYARIAAAGDLLGDFEAALNKLSEQLPANEVETRLLMKAARGEALARRGEWKKGYELIREAATQRGCSIMTWYTAVWMAMFLDDQENYRSLCVYGMARFASGADAEISRRLAESLNDPWSGMATHPIVKELQEQAQKGSAQNRFYNLMGVAWSEYLAGHLVEAERTIGEFISQYESSHSFYVADGYFVQAIIKAKLGRISEAREAYRKGLPHASRHFQNRGIPYDGAWWDEGVCIEINRREAAALLNAAGLMADDQFQLREAPLTK